MIKTGYPRPCPIPGHPQDENSEATLAAESAWSRLRTWFLHAPSERLPLPLVLTAWPLAWILHAAHVPGHVITYAATAATAACWLTWRRHERSSPHPRLLPAEAALVAAAIGGWIAAAVTLGTARSTRSPPELGIPGRGHRRVHLAAPPRGRPGCPPAPRGRRRLGGPEGRMAPGRPPDRPR